MKKYCFLVMLLLSVATLVQSQNKVMQVHRGGSVVYEIPTTQVDSIVFGEMQITNNIRGIWEVKAISISGELTNIDLLPDNRGISITIPNTTQGYIIGNTFVNKIDFEFEIRENQQISFKNYGSTRSAEDDRGAAFRDHIMFNVVQFKISNSVAWWLGGKELHFIDSQDNSVIVFINYLDES